MIPMKASVAKLSVRGHLQPWSFEFHGLWIPFQAELPWAVAGPFGAAADGPEMNRYRYGYR